MKAESLVCDEKQEFTVADVILPESPGGRHRGPRSPKVLMKCPGDIMIKLSGEPDCSGVHLADGKTLAAFHHNRHHDRNYVNLGDNPGMKDRSEIWVSLSSDGGRSWSVPRFVIANAAAPNLANGWFNWQCSYLDAFTDNGILHLFVPHRWQRCLHLQLAEAELQRLPTAKEL